MACAINCTDAHVRVIGLFEVFCRSIVKKIAHTFTFSSSCRLALKGQMLVRHALLRAGVVHTVSMNARGLHEDRLLHRSAVKIVRVVFTKRV